MEVSSLEWNINPLALHSIFLYLLGSSKHAVLTAVLRIRLNDQVRVHPENTYVPRLAWKWFNGRMLSRKPPAWLEQALRKETRRQQAGDLLLLWRNQAQGVLKSGDRQQQSPQGQAQSMFQVIGGHWEGASRDGHRPASWEVVLQARNWEN